MNALDQHSYTPAQREEGLAYVLALVAGGKSVSQALREGRAAGMPVPSSSVFWVWHQRDLDLQDKLARARLNGVEAQLEDAQDILDGTDIERDEDGTLKNPADAYLMETNRAKARADFRVKRAQMIAPRKYGPKLDVTSDGAKLHDPERDTAGAVIDILSSVARRIEGQESDDALPALPSGLADLLS